MYVHTYMQIKHILMARTSTRFNPYFGSMILHLMLAPKIGVKSCRGARECVSFVHIRMYIATQLPYLSRHLWYKMMYCTCIVMSYNDIAILIDYRCDYDIKLSHMCRYIHGR